MKDLFEKILSYYNLLKRYKEYAEKNLADNNEKMSKDVLNMEKELESMSTLDININQLLFLSIITLLEKIGLIAEFNSFFHQCSHVNIPLIDVTKRIEEVKEILLDRYDGQLLNS